MDLAQTIVSAVAEGVLAPGEPRRNIGGHRPVVMKPPAGTRRRTRGRRDDYCMWPGKQAGRARLYSLRMVSLGAGM